MTIAFFDAAQVEDLLDYPGCIGAMRRAMVALSSGERPQPLRQIFTVGENEMFGTMPGELRALSTFGAKLVSVFHEPDGSGRTRHQGVVVAYDGETGAVSCIADAEPVTKIRTGCATAVATDALARKDAEVLAIFGTGVQAESHVRAVSLMRQFREILLWGQSPKRTRILAEQLSSELGRKILAVADGRVVSPTHPARRMGKARDAPQPGRLELPRAGRGRRGARRQGSLRRRLSSGRPRPGRRISRRARCRVNRRLARGRRDR